MSGHTKGPWRLGLSYDGMYQEINSASGCFDGLARVVIRTGLSGSDVTEGAANARLIAAAPSLEKSAQYAISELSYYINNPSAWESYSENVSEAIRRVVDDALCAIAEAGSNGPAPTTHKEQN